MAYLRSKTTGVRIRGSSDRMLCTTSISDVTKNDDGTLNVEYGDGYENLYDSIEQLRTESGELLWLGDDGFDYPESDLEIVSDAGVYSDKED